MAANAKATVHTRASTTPESGDDHRDDSSGEEKTIRAQSSTNANTNAKDKGNGTTNEYGDINAFNGTTNNNTNSTAAARRRHAKGLSLNLPILLPPPTPQMSQSQSQSPTAYSSYSPGPVHSARSSPRIRTSPFRQHHHNSDAFKSRTSTGTNGDPSKSRTSADFLTLLAAQERRVLELREELQKAEADLLGLKKQWATYEANKKREEVKHVKKLQALPLDDVPSPSRDVAGPFAEDEVDEERRRRRELLQKGHTVNNTNPNMTTVAANGLGRRGSKRVFEGGRHTRALSLLSPTSARYMHNAEERHARGSQDGQLSDGRNSRDPQQSRDARDRPDGLDEAGLHSGAHERLSSDSPSGLPSSDNALDRPSLVRTSTLDALISSDPLQLGFGKTYKELASHRRSLPPVAADLLVKQGKQVYDGMRDGLWTFWEDIRQATVGEEGINGTAQQQRPTKAATSSTARKSRNRKEASSSGLGLGLGLGLTRTNAASSAEDRDRGRDGASKEPSSSFWREFGLDTPHKEPVSVRQALDKDKIGGSASRGRTRHGGGGLVNPLSDNDEPNGTGSDSDSGTGGRDHIQQKNSTDSTNPPSLLPDLNDNEDDDDDEEVDDSWDAWDSPVTTRRACGPDQDILTPASPVAPAGSGNAPKGADHLKTADGSGDDDGDGGLPWPEIPKLTPSKLTRTVSDLMREWDAGSKGADGNGNGNGNGNITGDDATRIRA